MKKHRPPAPATATGPSAKKILLCGLLSIWLTGSGPAAGQTTPEPPPVESFTLGSENQAAASGDDTLMEDLFGELIENNTGQTPAASGAPPLPPGTPLRGQAPQRTENPSVSGSFSQNDGQGGPTAGASTPPGPTASPGADPAASPFPPPPVPVPAASTPWIPPSAPGSPAETDAAGTASVPLGEGSALPPPDWQNVSGPLSRPASRFVSDAPAPQFDASQGQWMELEIGQTDQVGAAAPAPRPSSVSTVPPSSWDPDAPAEAAAPPQQSPAPGGVRTPERREQLRQLFPEFTSADALEAPTAASEPGRAGPPVPDFSALPSPEAGRDAPVADYDGSSAILKAGGLLGQEGRYGGAEILPPLTSPLPAKTATPAAEPSPKRAATPAKTASTPSPKTPKKKPASAAPQRATPRVAPGRLAIVNETGNPRIGEIYQSVLSRAGHQVVTLSQGAAGASSGKTVITYRPGFRAQAQAVARHLPGQKVLTEIAGGPATPSDVTIHIR